MLRGAPCIEVSDDGPGMSPQVMARAGEPYFTTRAGTGALGLGLFVARGIAEAHGGCLELESRPGEGTRARIVLPAGAERAKTFSL